MRRTPQQHGLTVGIAAILLAGTVPVVAQEVTVRSGQSLQLRGFLSGTLFLQDAVFGLGNGQQAAFVNEERSEWWHGGDVRNAWAQLGFDVTEQWSLWGYAGVDDPDDEDVARAEAERLCSWLIVPMLRFASEPVSVGLEWLHNRVDQVPETGTGERRGNQLLFSVRYDF